MMTRISLFFATLLLALSVAGAQQGQPNSDISMLRINGQEGPPYPIVNVPVYGGTSAALDIDGGANVHFVLVQAPSLTPNSVPFLGGVIDLDLTSNPGGVVFLMDGFGVNPELYKTDSLGHFGTEIPIAPSIPQNTQVAFQVLMEEPASHYFLQLTAATSIITHQGVLPITFNLGNNNCLFAATGSQFGINIPFYASTYNGCWVCSNGYLTFGGPDTDFTPSLSEMHSTQPRIAPFWSDLDPSVGTAGPITMLVDQRDINNPILTFRYSHIPDWAVGVTGGLGWHTFGVRIDIVSGDIEIHEYAVNQNSNYDILVGLSAGLSLDPTGPGTMDLSAQFAQGVTVGLPNEGFYEGFAGNTSVTGQFPFSQVYDLAGNFWRYNAIGPGAPGAYYLMDFFVPSDPLNP